MRTNYPVPTHIHSRARQVARDVRRVVNPVDGEMSEQMRNWTLRPTFKAKRMILEQYLLQSKAFERDHIPDVPGVGENWDSDDLEDGNEDDITTLRNVRNFMLSSRAFRDLRMKPSRSVYPDMLKSVQKQIMAEFKTPGRHDATFRVPWNILEFCEKELDGNRDIRRLLTIACSGKAAFASACEEYMHQTWPNTGKYLLETLKTALDQTNNYNTFSVISRKPAKFLTFSRNSMATTARPTAGWQSCVSLEIVRTCWRSLSNLRGSARLLGFQIQ
jgi:hypothetical protein